MKKRSVRISLSAFTRVSYEVVVEVDEAVANSPQKLQDLANRTWDETDGGDFVDDADYWEKGTVEAELLPEGDS